MFRADMMVDTNDATLQDGPKALNGVCVNITPDIFPRFMIDYFMGVKSFFQIVVGVPFVRHDDSVSGDFFLHDALKGFLAYVRNGLGRNPSTTFYHSKYGSLCGPASAFVSESRFARVSQCAFTGLATNICFVSFDYSVQRFGGLCSDSVTNPMQHEPRGLLSNSNIFPQLNGRDTLLVCGNEIDSHEPLLEGKGRIFKDGSNANGELFSTIGTLKQLAV